MVTNCFCATFLYRYRMCNNGKQWFPPNSGFLVWQRYSNRVAGRKCEGGKGFDSATVSLSVSLFRRRIYSCLWFFFGLKMYRMVGPLVWMSFPWKPNNTERNWHFKFVPFDASLNVLLARQVMFACLNLNLRGWKTHTQTCNKSQELRTRSLNFFFYLFIAFFM